MGNALQKACSLATLREVWKANQAKLRKSCFGSDRTTGEMFGRGLERELRELRHRTETGYTPDGLLAIPKVKSSGAYRIICVPTVADRLLQFSVLNTLRPKLRAMGLDNPVSYGLVSGADRSVLGARKVACKARAEKPWVYKADITQFFDNLNRSRLKELIETLPLPTMRPLLSAIVDAEITDGISHGWQEIVSSSGIIRGRGVRQGMPLSPWLSGLYLRELDRKLAKSGIPVVRYVDDIVAFFDSNAECEAFHTLLRDSLDAMGLHIGDLGAAGSKTMVYAPEEPAAFLGMEITRRDGRYRLLVPDSVFADLEGKFADASTPAGLMALRVRLTDMGRYFRSLESGYLNAYAEAENRDRLRDRLELLALAAQQKVLEDIFTVERLLDMSPEERRFVGIERVGEVEKSRAPKACSKADARPKPKSRRVVTLQAVGAGSEPTKDATGLPWR